MIIQIITRTFHNKEDLKEFERFFSNKWKILINTITNCKLRLLQTNENSHTFNAVWEFPDRSTQNKVMKLIKLHNKDFKFNIPKKTTNISGKVIIELHSRKSI